MFLYPHCYSHSPQENSPWYLPKDSQPASLVLVVVPVASMYYYILSFIRFLVIISNQLKILLLTFFPLISLAIILGYLSLHGSIQYSGLHTRPSSHYFSYSRNILPQFPCLLLSHQFLFVYQSTPISK